MSARPTLDELNALMSRAVFGEVRDGEMDGLKVVHIGQPGGEYHIYHRQDLWEGSKAQTVLHEAYEIIHETLCEMHTGTRPDRNVCRQADRFAAAVPMQREGFALLAEASGLDVTALQREYRCAYVSVTLRLAQLLRTPLMAVLYEREKDGDPVEWPAVPDLAQLRATVVKRTAGFAAPRSRLLNGRRGGIPRKGKPLFPQLPAGQAARSGRPEYGEGDGLAVIASPSSGRGGWPRCGWWPCPNKTGPSLTSSLPAQTQ